jgi:hypothetical protein
MNDCSNNLVIYLKIEIRFSKIGLILSAYV